MGLGQADVLTGDGLSFSANLHVMVDIQIAFHLGERLAPFNRPQPSDAIGSGRGDHLPIGSHRDSGDGSAMIDADQLFSALDLPDADRTVFAARDKLISRRQHER